MTRKKLFTNTRDIHLLKNKRTYNNQSQPPYRNRPRIEVIGGGTRSKIPLIIGGILITSCGFFLYYFIFMYRTTPNVPGLPPPPPPPSPSSLNTM